MSDTVRRVRDAFLAAGYTTDGVLELLGPHAHAALARDETVPARRATAGGSPLETLVRLFLLQLPVPERQAGNALPLTPAIALGLLERDGADVRAALDVRPYGTTDDQPGARWYVVSDLGTGLDGVVRPLPEDHVLGVGAASMLLAQLTPRHAVLRALDVGTGSGVQVLHLAAHAGAVTATDISARALRLARLTARLSVVEVELRSGSLYEPVARERFDLIVSNPPFVIGPGARHTYRDSGLPGDELCRRLVASSEQVLDEDGMLVMLANWVHRAGESWQERVGSWLPAQVDAWVVQRDVADPAAYVGTWLRDSGEAGSPGYVDAYDTWLRALEADGVEAVGFGWVVLRTAGAGSARVEEWPHPVEQPLGPYVHRLLDAQAWLVGTRDEDLLAATLVLADDVVQEQVGAPGAADPELLLLRGTSGMRRVRRVDTEAAAAAGACDGTLPLGALLDAVATVLAEDPAKVRARVLPQVRGLVEDGMLVRAR